MCYNMYTCACKRCRFVLSRKRSIRGVGSAKFVAQGKSWSPSALETEEARAVATIGVYAEVFLF
jgi:hypothetical protein